MGQMMRPRALLATWLIAVGGSLIAAPAGANLLSRGTTTRVSVSTTGDQANSVSFFSAVSSDGRYVAFDSSASNLVPGERPFVGGVFMRDVLSGSTIGISLDDAGGWGDGFSQHPSISSDGRLVAFDSTADNLVADGGGNLNVFLRDTRVSQTRLVSGAYGGGLSDGSSSWPAMSADGDTVAFFSTATDLINRPVSTPSIFRARREYDALDFPKSS
jgi:Tol biopolymer transport system component